MGERDRQQSQYERERARLELGEGHREQRRLQPREWEPSQEHWSEARDRERHAAYYNERQYGTRGNDEREQGTRFGAEDESRRGPHDESGRRYTEEPAFSRDRERDWREQRYAGPERSYGSGYVPGPNQSSPSYRQGPSHGSRFSQSDAYQRSWHEQPARGDQRSSYAENDYTRRGRDGESFGDQLRHAGHSIARTVKRAFRGPKGYKRSDERIREDVSDRLGEHEHLDCSDIEVSVSSGEVTLTGVVQSRQEKFLAEEIADDVSGVNDVHNQLRVKRDRAGDGAISTTESAATQSGTEAARTRNARA